MIQAERASGRGERRAIDDDRGDSARERRDDDGRRIDEGRVERLHLYTQERMRHVLGAASFREVRFYEGWSEEPYRGGEVMVVTARK